MDVKISSREVTARRRRRQLLTISLVVLAGVGLYAATYIAAATPSVDTQGIWIDTVKHGEMARELHGVGELAPNDDASRWVAAELEARVDRKLLEAGAEVTAGTVLMQLSNPDVDQAAVAANLALDAAQAAYASLEASLQNDLLALRSSVAAIDADREQAALQAEVDAGLAKDGLLSEVTARQSGVRAKSLATRLALEQNRLQAVERSLTARLATERANVESHRTVAELKRRDLASMTVRAGMDGVLQEVAVSVGQRVSRSANLARIVDPASLKAQLRIPEAQTDSLRTGLPVQIDTHNGIVPGRVSRIAPAAQNGSVLVDVTLGAALPRGARPDMTIDGTIELERLANVRHIGRPASGQQEGEATLFRVSADGARAERVTVRLGRASANEVEIVDGDLKEGDRVVLSDTSAWNAHQMVRLR